MRWLLVWVLQSSVLAESPETISFNEHIQPLLAREHCLHCHGPDASQRKGDLRLDLEAAARSSAIVAGNPQANPLMERVCSVRIPMTPLPPPEEGKAPFARGKASFCALD